MVPDVHSNLSLIIKISLLLLILLLISACGGSGADTEDNVSAGALAASDYTGPPPAFPDVQAFRVNLWERIRGNDRCGQCHSRGNQAPFFARSDDVNLAYEAALPLVNLNDPSLSRLVEKVGGGHNCWLGDNEACADIMTTWVEGWAGGPGNSARQIVLTAPPIRDPGENRNFPYNPDGTAPASYQPIYDILRANCSGCHAIDGSPQTSPYFASADANESYELVRPRINLDQPELSRVVVRLREESHNCWTASCENDATTMETAIRNFAALITPDSVDPDEFTFSKAMQLGDGIVASGGNRYESNQIAFWEFKTGSGNIAYDTSGVDPAIDLTLIGNVSWFGGWGINIVDGRAQGSAAASRKLADAIVPTGEFAVEAWVVPANVTQEEANIISYSGSNTTRNFTLGQTLYNYDFFTRSSDAGDTAANGQPALSTADDDERLQATLQHVVVNYDPVNGRSVYVNGVWTGDVDPTPAGTLSSWNESFALIMGNETSGERLWQGIIRMAAVHNRVLTPAQIQQNFDVGVGEKYFLLFYLGDILTDVSEPYLLIEVSVFDSHAYLFNEPRYISLDPDETRDNIDIAGIRIGINGRLADVGQGFQRIDTRDPNFDEPYTSDGQYLLRQGTIIASESGPDSDEFFLTFDVLGNQTNVYIEPEPLIPGDPADGLPAPDIGLRTFDEISATLAEITTVNPRNSGVQFTFNRVRAAMPTVENAGGFLAAHQMAVAQLAIEYCDALVDNSTKRAAYWPDIDFPVSMPELFGLSADPDVILDPLVDRITLPETPGDGLSSQPDVDEMKTELNSLMGRLTACYDPVGGVNNCEAGRPLIVLKAVCAAAVGNAAMLVQ